MFTFTITAKYTFWLHNMLTSVSLQLRATLTDTDSTDIGETSSKGPSLSHTKTHTHWYLPCLSASAMCITAINKTRRMQPMHDVGEDLVLDGWEKLCVLSSLAMLLFRYQFLCMCVSVCVSKTTARVCACRYKQRRAYSTAPPNVKCHHSPVST